METPFRYIIHSSYKRGTQAPVAYNFFPNEAPRQNILEAPHNVIYHPLTVEVISTLSVWLTDQHGKLLDLTWRGIDHTFSSSRTLAVCIYSIK